SEVAIRDYPRIAFAPAQAARLHLRRQRGLLRIGEVGPAGERGAAIEEFQHQRLQFKLLALKAKFRGQERHREVSALCATAEPCLTAEATCIQRAVPASPHGHTREQV